MNKRYPLLAASCFMLTAQAAENLETVEVFGRRIEGLGLSESTAACAVSHSIVSMARAP